MEFWASCLRAWQWFSDGYLGGIFWILGAILSCVGLGNRKTGWAWAGFIISFAWLIVYVVLGFIFSSFVYFTLWPYLIW